MHRTLRFAQYGLVCIAGTMGPIFVHLSLKKVTDEPTTLFVGAVCLMMAVMYSVTTIWRQAKEIAELRRMVSECKRSREGA